MWPIKRILRSERGSILLPALFFLVILAVIGAIALNTMRAKYRLSFQTASWQEALLSAEAAVEVGMNEVRKTVFEKPEDATDDPFLPANGWTEYPAEFADNNGNGAYDGPEIDGEWKIENGDDKNGNGLPDPWPTWVFSSQLLHRDTEGGTDSKYHAVVDIPFRHPRNHEPYYRVRAWGEMEIPGTGITAGEKKDNWLRKLSLRTERRTKQALERPHARRYIEVVLKPITAFHLAVFAIKSINLTDHNILIDSWDSNDTSKYPGGLYPSESDPAISEEELNQLRNHNGDIATNGKVINAGGAHVYGDAATNGGTAGTYGVLEAENVTGEIANDFEQEVFAVRTPQVVSTDVGAIGKGVELIATPDTVASYSTNQIKLSGDEVLHLKGARNADGTPQLNPDGTPVKTYIQIVVNGSMSLSGNAQITLDEGVYVRFFLTEGADITGNGFQNPNSALNLQIYGVDTNPDGTPRGDAGTAVGEIKIAGNGGFKGAVYAPRFDLEFKGGGNSDNVFGSFTGLNVKMTGVSSIHYDEAMSNGGVVIDYKIASWFEDVL